ncbi:S41 family peptidase [Kordia sp.]|uniref:S41 family peptidase n=1 Tax=Kordia sp. TaxID=1965332 RepID=UPI0025C04D15|nr:S41 family peptidase [Kordia sp.]MCH2196933.1 PDZ domain-containing protein [Kordia sp.]
MKPNNRLRISIFIITLCAFVSFCNAQNVIDTRLMTDPAISKDRIAFIYAEDLWVANRDGSNPIRLTIDEGIESRPRFSPDGSKIAFSAQYDGNTDVFIVNTNGGVPKRLTWNPYYDRVRGFDASGKHVLFSSRRHSHVYHHRQLYLVNINGGPIKKLPIPTAHYAAYSPDNEYIAYTPFPNAHKQWKNYRGGRQARIWIYNTKNHEVVEIPKPTSGSNDTNPQWIGDTVYFRSDRNGEFNIYSYDTNSKQITQHTDYKKFPVLYISASKKDLIYEQEGYLHIYDPTQKKKTKLTIGIATDLLEMRPRFVSGRKYVRNVSISPTGKRLVADFRGEIVTIPVKKGDVKNITETTGVHEKSPKWSPDGKHIAYLSDATGEYELHIQNLQDSNTQKIKLGDVGFYGDLHWSPDGKKISYSDHTKSLYILDIASEKSIKIASDVLNTGGSTGYLFRDWSYNSKWITYVIKSETLFEKAYIYSVDQNKSYSISDGSSHVSEAIFDHSGKYIYMTASTNAGPVVNWFDLSNRDSEMTSLIYVVTLQKNTISPLAKKNDEEAIVEKVKGTTNSDEKKNTDFTIDFEGIQNRVVALPIGSGQYYDLASVKEGELLYIDGEPHSSYYSPQPLKKYSLSNQKEKEIMRASWFHISANGKKMLYYKQGNYGVVNVGDKPKNSTVNLSSIKIKIDPPKEWRNIFNEAWRVNRDYFYDPNMHGLDWNKMKKKYEPFLADVTTQNDLYRVMQWMFSELSVGHHRFGYTRDWLNKAPYINGGLLGADYEIKNNRYQITKIYKGSNWTPSLRAPLNEPGINVNEGDYIIKVNGKNVTGKQNIYAFFENTVDKIVTLTVSTKADGSDARVYKVVPIYDEIDLRSLSWVEENIKKVDKATNGQVGYVFVPNTSDKGHEYFKRYFYPQTNKKGIIVDERFNGGGHLADYYLDILNRKKMSNWSFRHGATMSTPSASIDGPKVLLINEGAGSGGDYFPWAFRKMNLGTIVGKRTWGGLVGISGFPRFIDRGYVTAPHFAFWDENGFGIENVGVAPDVEVDQLPKDVIAGKDPQLEKAIEIALKQLKENPPTQLKQPKFPIRVRKEQNKL